MRRARLALGVALLLFALVLAVLLATGSASAEEAPQPRPLSEGGEFFPTIRDPTYPEEYSFRVTLGEGQELVQIDDRTVAVKYSNGLTSFSIGAEAASDAEGATVPTSIEVTGEDVFTLTVHHRAGNSAAGGAPFDYPIVDGPGWEGGFHTEIVVGPLDEAQLRERREREEAAARGAAPVDPVPAVRHCVVPKLKGLNLIQSRHRLRAADCAVGTVHRSVAVSARSGRVVEQSPKPGGSLAAGTAVGLRLG